MGTEEPGGLQSTGGKELDMTEVTEHPYQFHTDLITVIVVQALSSVQLFVTPWTAAHLDSLLFFNISLGLLKLTSIDSVMSPNHLVLYHPILLLPSIFPKIRVFSNESAIHIR